MNTKEITTNFAKAIKKCLDMFIASDVKEFITSFSWNQREYKIKMEHYNECVGGAETITLLRRNNGWYGDYEILCKLIHYSKGDICAWGQFVSPADAIYSENDNLPTYVDNDAMCALLVNWKKVKSSIEELVSSRDEALSNFQL